MKLEKDVRGILFIFMLGFLGGIIYTNVVVKASVTVTNVFHESFLSQYTQITFVTWDYILYLLRCRLTPIGILGIGALTKWRKLIAAAFVIWTGFSGGVLAVTAVLRMGSAGMLICLVALFPHYIFYVVSYLVIVWYCWQYPKVSWNRGKLFFVAFMYFTGIVAEAYLNPHIVSFFMNLLM